MYQLLIIFHHFMLLWIMFDQSVKRIMIELFKLIEISNFIYRLVRLAMLINHLSAAKVSCVYKNKTHALSVD